MPKKYHIGDLLGVTTGILLRDGHFGEVRDLDETYGKTELYQQMPWLKQIKFPDQAFDALKDQTREQKLEFLDNWLKQVVAKYGEYHDVYPRGQAPEIKTSDISRPVNPQRSLRNFVRKRGGPKR